MPETLLASTQTLSEAMLLRRLQAFEQNRAFFIEMWLQNPVLARQAGGRLRNLLLPLKEVQAREASLPGFE